MRFNEYQTNSIKKHITQYNLLNQLLLLYGYKIEYYGSGGSTEEQAEEWLNSSLFRLGASRLANNLLTDIYKKEVKYF